MVAMRRRVLALAAVLGALVAWAGLAPAGASNDPGFPGQWNQPDAKASGSCAMPFAASTVSASGVRPSTGTGSVSASHGVAAASSSRACAISSRSHATRSASRSSGGVSRPSSAAAWLGC